MAKCRYYAMCDICDRAGDDWLPCDGTDDGTTCGHFEPMPDVESLLKLADEMDLASEDGLLVRDSDLMAWAIRIREALGETRKE